MLSEEVLPDDLKYFNTGDCIGMGIDVGIIGSQSPAEARILYNSTNHPSRFTINTKPISIDIFNHTTTKNKAVVDLMITDAFGIYDIADYNVLINGPSGKNIVDFEIIEYEYQDQGILILRVIWDKSEDGSGNYSFIVKVVDNNNNKWEEIEVFEYDLSNDGIIEISPYLYVLSSIGIIILVLIYIFVIKKRKKRV
ncbi:MAG: hypothetical protein JSW00_02355 [Thermoplasmata archaeon]|nr:MAG: hypothetical protein JSW00_02355 [Thermoplasmata archaeon]